MRRPENALWIMCGAEGRIRQAEVVDHVISLERRLGLAPGSDQLAGPLQVALSRGKQAEERGFGKRRRIGFDGYHVDD